MSGTSVTTNTNYMVSLNSTVTDPTGVDWGPLVEVCRSWRSLWPSYWHFLTRIFRVRDLSEPQFTILFFVKLSSDGDRRLKIWLFSGSDQTGPELIRSMEIIIFSKSQFWEDDDASQRQDGSQKWHQGWRPAGTEQSANAWRGKANIFKSLRWSIDPKCFFHPEFIVIWTICVNKLVKTCSFKFDLYFCPQF